MHTIDDVWNLVNNGMIFLIIFLSFLALILVLHGERK